jgi:hypothetical protein
LHEYKKKKICRRHFSQKKSKIEENCEKADWNIVSCAWEGEMWQCIMRENIEW